MSDYQQEWQEYKRLRNQFWLVFACYVPVCFAIALVSIKLLQTFTPAFVAAFLDMGLFVLTGSRLQLWRCPRCVFGDMVVQLGLASEAMRSLRLAQI